MNGGTTPKSDDEFKDVPDEHMVTFGNGCTVWTWDGRTFDPGGQPPDEEEDRPEEM